jgi:hypothetical protein
LEDKWQQFTRVAVEAFSYFLWAITLSNKLIIIAIEILFAERPVA